VINGFTCERARSAAQRFAVTAHQIDTPASMRGRGGIQPVSSTQLNQFDDDGIESFREQHDSKDAVACDDDFLTACPVYPRLIYHVSSCQTDRSLLFPVKMILWTEQQDHWHVLVRIALRTHKPPSDEVPLHPVLLRR
jgi:hypothetical protein